MGEDDIASLRREYMHAGLDERDVAANPVDQFKVWFEAAQQAGTRDPNAMTLATADPDGRPSARIVLLKNVDADGFVFYTNYRSRKGRALDSHPVAALVFWWDALDRQVRVEGHVEKVAPHTSDLYFHSRPRASQLGALASEQSAVIKSRQVLEERVSAVSRECGDGEVPRPEWWGGYRLRHDSVEFWQGRTNRLHDRLHYDLENGHWRIKRLSP